METTISAVYDLPSALEVGADCFGAEIRLQIGSLAGIAKLPLIHWVDSGHHGPEPTVGAPSIDEVVSEPILRHIKTLGQTRSIWGSVSGYNPATKAVSGAYVGAIFMELSVMPESITYSEYLHGLGSPQGPGVDELIAEVDNWFDRLRTWIEVSTGQDADPNQPLSIVSEPGRGLTIVARDATGAMSLPAAGGLITISTPTPRPVALAGLVKAIERANAGDTPGLAHLLLRDGRAAMARNQLRRAVIDVGAAVELALVQFNATVTHVGTGSGQSLGFYVKHPRISVDANLPAETFDDLVQVRNDAIHQNQTPTPEKAGKAVSLARQIVEHLDPIA